MTSTDVVDSFGPSCRSATIRRFLVFLPSCSKLILHANVDVGKHLSFREFSV